MKIYKNISQLITLSSAFKKDGRNLKSEDLSIIDDGAVVFIDKKILWVGKTHELPSEFKHFPSTNLNGFVLTPEIVDSHTHLVFGGSRSHEYFMRMNGASYEEIAKAGGGILYTVTETNKMSEDQLFDLAFARVKKMANLGVGTIEIKTGYSLTVDGEYKLAKIINRLKKIFSPKIQIISTFMGAHATPQGMNSKQYLNEIAIPSLEKCAQDNLVDQVDIFHEDGYFSTEEVFELARVAAKLHLPFKTHADEFKDGNGAATACQILALSTDHLLCISDEGIKKLSASKTVATLLPGTAFFLGKPLAPARKLLDAGAKLAIASDYNPGSNHNFNLISIASHASMQFKMNACELLSAITLNSAHALGLINQGAVIEGMHPRFTIFKTNKIENIFYNWGENLAVSTLDDFQ
jgi:imidazolonepropionase